MNKTIYEKVKAVFVVFLLNVLFLLWMPYSKGIINTVGKTDWYFDLITKLIYFVLFYIFIIHTFIGKRHNISRKKQVVIYVKYILLFIAVQCIIDVFRIYIPMSSIVALILNDSATILASVLPILFVSILAKKKANSKANKVAFIIAFCIIIAAVGCLVFYDISKCELINKTKPSERLYTSINTDFWHDVVLLILDTIISGAFLCLNKSGSKQNKVTSQKDEKRIIVPVLMLRAFVVFAALTLLMLTKMFILPHSAISGFSHFSLTTDSTEDEYVVDTFKTTIKRFTDRHNSKDVFCITKYKIISNGDTVKSGYLDGEHIAKIDGSSMYSVIVKEKEITVYSDKVLIYTDNGKICAADLTDLSDSNDIIIDFLEDRISSEHLEYVNADTLAYIQRFDKGFINEYIKRYSIHDFTEYETKNNTNEDLDYICELAQDYN